MKIGLSILVILFLISLFSFVSGYQLGVGPPEINLKSGECLEIYVFSEDYSGEIEVSDRWAEKRGNSFGDYDLNAEEEGLDVRYFKNFELNGTGKSKICINGYGKYYGLMLFRTVEGNLEVGTRIFFDGGGIMSRIGGSLISGRVMSDANGFLGRFGAREAVLLSSFAVSLALLWFLFFILRQNREKEG